MPRPFDTSRSNNSDLKVDSHSAGPRQGSEGCDVPRSSHRVAGSIGDFHDCVVDVDGRMESGSLKAALDVTHLRIIAVFDDEHPLSSVRRTFSSGQRGVLAHFLS